MCLDIDQEFKEQLVQLVPTLLSAENLVEKEIGGAKVTCRDLLHYFKVARAPCDLVVIPALRVSLTSLRTSQQVNFLCLFSVLHKDLPGGGASSSQIDAAGWYHERIVIIISLVAI